MASRRLLYADRARSVRGQLRRRHSAAMHTLVHLLYAVREVMSVRSSVLFLCASVRISTHALDRSGEGNRQAHKRRVLQCTQ